MARRVVCIVMSACACALLAVVVYFVTAVSLASRRTKREVDRYMENRSSELTGPPRESIL